MDVRSPWEKEGRQERERRRRSKRRKEAVVVAINHEGLERSGAVGEPERAPWVGGYWNGGAEVRYGHRHVCVRHCLPTPCPIDDRR